MPNPRMPDETLLRNPELFSYSNNTRNAVTVAAKLGIASNKLIFKLSDIRRMLKMLAIGTVDTFPIRYSLPIKITPPSTCRFIEQTAGNVNTFSAHYVFDNDEIVCSKLDQWHNVWTTCTIDEFPEKYRYEWLEYKKNRLELKTAPEYRWVKMPMNEVLYHFWLHMQRNRTNHNERVYSSFTNGLSIKSDYKMLSDKLSTVLNRTFTQSEVSSVFRGEWNIAFTTKNDYYMFMRTHIPYKYRTLPAHKPESLNNFFNCAYYAKYKSNLSPWRIVHDSYLTENYYFIKDVNTVSLIPVYPQINNIVIDEDVEESTARIMQYDALRHTDGSMKIVRKYVRKIDIKNGFFPKCNCCNVHTLNNSTNLYHKTLATNDGERAIYTLSELLDAVTIPHQDSSYYEEDLRKVSIFSVNTFESSVTLTTANAMLSSANGVAEVLDILKAVQDTPSVDTSAPEYKRRELVSKYKTPNRVSSGWTSQQTVLARGIKPEDCYYICRNCMWSIFEQNSNSSFNEQSGIRSTSAAARILERNGRGVIRQYTSNPMDIHTGFRTAKGESPITEIVKQWSSTGRSYKETKVNRTPYLGIELEVTPSINAFNLINKIRYSASNNDIDKIGVQIAAEITHNFLNRKGLGILKLDGSVHNGFELVSVPGTHKWHTEEGWHGFFKEDYQEGMKHLAPAYYLSGWDNNCIEKLHPYTGKRILTPSCGIHIHVSRDALSPMQFCKMLKFVNADGNRKFIELVAGRTANQYARMQDKNIKAGAKFIKAARSGFLHRRREEYYNDSSLGGRYEAINVNTQGKPTIEFRIFRSNVSKAGFMKNLDFVQAVIAWCAVASNQNITSLDFIEFVNKNRGHYKYLASWLVENDRLARIHKFNEKHVEKKELVA